MQSTLTGGANHLTKAYLLFGGNLFDWQAPQAPPLLQSGHPFSSGVQSALESATQSPLKQPLG